MFQKHLCMRHWKKQRHQSGNDTSTGKEGIQAADRGADDAGRPAKEQGDKGIQQDMQSKVSHKKSNAMKVRVYSDMCPYCEEEVEFYDLRDQQCPYCGLHFTPAQDSYYEDVEED